MKFEITSNQLPDHMYPGMIIRYKVSPLPFFRVTWVTEITQVKDQSFFIDEQRVGPFRLWHHQHILTPTDDGVLMEDIVTYQPPLGILGAIANSLFIKRQLKRIFSYRKEVVEKLFS